MNESQILSKLAELNTKLTANNQQVFKLNFDLANKVLSKSDKTQAYMSLNSLELQKEQIIKEARKLAKTFLTITNEVIN
jgi:hypothetical protein